MKQFSAPVTFTRLIFLISILLVHFDIRAQFNASGNSAGTVTTTSVTQGFDWVNPSNIQTANSVYATSLITGANRSTYYLDAKNWGFQSTTSGQVNYIPPTATINGIEVYITRRRSNTGTIKGNKTQLLKAGAEAGVNKSTGTTWSTTATTAVFGSSVDLWGTAWTPSDFINANFGVRIQARNQGNKPAQAEVDYVRIVVYFNQTFYNSKSTGNLELTSTWGLNADGTGTAPPNFTNNGQIFVLRNRASASLTANLTISGTNSKMVAGDGTAATALTIPSGFILNSVVDIAAGSSLIINNTTTPAIGAIGPNTTITYGASADQVVPEKIYHNLTLSGSGIKSLQTVSGSTLINNVLTIETGATFNNQGNTVIVSGTANGISNSGSAAGTGRYVYLASDINTSITGTGPATYSNLEVDFSTTAATRTLTLANAATITGTLYLSDGSFANSTNLTMAPGSAITVVDGTLASAIAGSSGYDVIYDPYSTSSPKTTGNEISGTLRNFTLQTGGGLTVNLNRNLVLTGNLQLTSGTLDPTATAYNISVGGNLVNNGTLTQRNNTTTFNGSVAQAISGSGSQTFYNLAINNGAGGSLQLNVPVMVTNGLTLTNGIVTTSGINLLTLSNAAATISGGSSSSYINGPLQHTLSAVSGTRIFPIGKGTSYKPISLSVNQVGATATGYTAELFDGSPPVRTLPPTLEKVSEIRYYTATTSNAANLLNAAVTINYGPDDGVTDAPNLRIAKSNGSIWENIGGIGTASPTGTITSNTFTSFSDFVLANAIGGNNVLPLRWVTFEAGKSERAVQLSWQTMDEVNTLHFDVERSSNGNLWTVLGRVNSNNGPVNNYSFTDKTPLSHVNLYRLKSVDRDGKNSYSRTAIVNFNERNEGFTIMPNPVTSGELTCLLYDAGILQQNAVLIRIIDMNGKTVITSSQKPVPVMKINVGLLIPGNYLLYIQSNDRYLKKSFMIVK